MSAALALAACSAAPLEPPTIVLGAASPAPSIPAPVTVPVRAPRPVQAIVWESSEPAARERARRVGLPLIVFARADWAAAALEMERQVWTDPRVIAAAEPFVAVRLELTATEGDADLYVEHYDLSGLPTTVIFNARGRRVATLFGFQDADRLVAALRDAVE